MKRVLLLMAIFLCITLLFGCKPKEVIVEVPTIQKEYVYNDSIQHDSVYYHDSVYIEKGDSIVCINKIQYRYKYRYIAKTDSFVSRDTIYQPYEKVVEKVVEKPLSGIQQFYMLIGKTISIGLLIFIVSYFILQRFKKR